MAEEMKNLIPVELKERIDYLSGQEIGHNGIYYVQDVGEKVAGKLYMCRTMKKIFRCKANNTLTYIDDSKYESMSLETLLDKLQNLSRVDVYKATPMVSAGNIDIRAYAWNNMLFISAYIDTGNYQISNINGNGTAIAKLDLPKKAVGVMSSMINNTNNFSSNIRLTQDGHIYVESTIPNIPSLTRMGFAIISSLWS